MGNKKLLIGLIVLFVAALMGCSDDNGTAQKVKVGDPIRFAASTNDGTRTSYGDLADGKYPVYWENNDKVKIFCPQAQSSQDATYTVTGVTSGSQTIYELTGSNLMNWGAEDTHHFYTFYPADRVESCIDNVITATVPREQHVTAVSDGTNWTACNMDYALMVGHTTYKRSEATDETIIRLPFAPITTALDIEVKAPESGTSIVVSSITIANPTGQTDNRTALSGKFTYNVTNVQSDNDQWQQASVSDGSSIVRVVLDNPITLESGTTQTLKVTAFLLPEVPKKLRVIINGQQDVTNGATITPAKSINNVSSRKKTPVKLGSLPNNATFSYETWMANLADNVYLSQISMPGTHDAGAYVSGSITSGVAQTQTLDITSQLNAGVRILDFRPAYNGTDFDVAHGIVTLPNVTFDGILGNAVTWLANHPTETLIVMLKNESSGEESNESSNFRGWQKNIRGKLTAINPEYTIADFDPSMTLRDARGKMLFMSRDAYDGGWFGCKISGWGVDNGELIERKFYTASYPDGIGKFTYTDLYRSYTSYPPTEKDKKASIDKFLNAASNNTDVGSWYIGFLNVTSLFGSALGRPGRETGVYNSYAAEKINAMSSSKYENVGMVMLDWAGNATYSGDVIIKAVIDNNFRAGGPKRKQ